MTPTKANWALSFFWINLSIAIVVLILVATAQISSVRNLLHLLVYGLVYANLTGALAVLVIGGMFRRLALRKSPPIPLVAVSIVVLAAWGCLLAQTLLM